MATDDSPIADPQPKKPATEPQKDNAPNEKPFAWPKVDPKKIPDIIREHRNDLGVDLDV